MRNWVVVCCLVLVLVAFVGLASAAPTVEQSREETVVGTPVTVQVSGVDGTVAWTVTDAPTGSEVAPEAPDSRTTAFSPDRPGSYTLSVSTEEGTASVTLEAENRSTVIDEFAPILHFHEDGPYRPTRLEALVENSVLRTEGAVVVDEPTLLDLAERDGGHYLELDPGVDVSPSILSIGEQDLAHYLGLADETPRYVEYQDAYPPTVYANVNPETEYQGETYTAVTYWFIYTWDPKHGFAKFGFHQADVESAMVLVDNEGEPAYLAPKAHGATTVVPFEDADRTGTHPHLYVEHRSHATYLVDTTETGGAIQVYDHWATPDADCGVIDPFLSTFHDEHTGSAERWDPTGETGVSYDLIELTGDEVWATYEGGLAAAPGSITAPHQRSHYEDAGSAIEARSCSLENQVDGWVEITDVGADHVAIRVGNTGGTPHSFHVELVTDDGAVIADRRVPVAATGPTLFGDPTERVTIPLEGDAEVTAVLRSTADGAVIDRSVSVSLEDPSWWFW